MAQAATIFKIGGIVLLVLVALVLLGFVGFGVYRTYAVEHRANQQRFRSGKLPRPAPDGFYQGNKFRGFGDSSDAQRSEPRSEHRGWQGKIFNTHDQTGINKFTDGERFTFKTYTTQGLRDKDRQVLRIDYNQPGNPWWLHFIVDEIVETEPGHYLGKVHLQVIPGLPFTLTYFELTK